MLPAELTSVVGVAPSLVLVIDFVPFMPTFLNIQQKSVPCSHNIHPFIHFQFPVDFLKFEAKLYYIFS